MDRRASSVEKLETEGYSMDLSPENVILNRCGGRVLQSVGQILVAELNADGNDTDN